MMLSPSDWIYDGSGLLYTAPFVSRCLLYRLHDDNCSVLVLHEPAVSSTVRHDEKTGAFHCNAVVREPDCFLIHFADSSEALVEDIVNARPMRVKTTTAGHSFDKVSVEVAPYQLEAKRMFDVVGSSATNEHQIAHKCYRVRSRGTITHLGKAAPQQGTFFQCWKVSVVSNENKRSYSLDSPCKWSLAAIDPEGWQPTLELRPED